jgi:hypothetical protein
MPARPSALNETMSQHDTVRSRVAQFGRVASSFAFQPFTHPPTRPCAFTCSLTIYNRAHHACNLLDHHPLSHEQLRYHRRNVVQQLCSNRRHPRNPRPSPVFVSPLRAQGQTCSGLYAERVDCESQTWYQPLSHANPSRSLERTISSRPSSSAVSIFLVSSVLLLYALT